jgi:RNA polymerase sigma-70 factor (ECF subfamily)
MSFVPVDRSTWRALAGRIARRLGSSDDAEDLLHSAYVQMAEAGARRSVAAPIPYLVRSAVNLGIDHRRRDKLMDRSESAEEYCLDMADPAPLQDEVLTARTRLSRLRDGLDRLTPRTREVFLMHRLDGLKYRVIGERLGISQSAVEKHIARAVLFLTEWMEAR